MLEYVRLWDKLSNEEKCSYWRVKSLGEELSVTDRSSEQFLREAGALEFKLFDKLAQEEWTENTTRISSTNTERIFCMVSKRQKADAAQIYDTAGPDTAHIRSFTCSGIIYLHS